MENKDLYLGRLNKQNGNNNQAIENFQNCIRNNRNKEESYWAKIFIAEITQKEEDFLEAIKQYPDRLEAIYALSMLCYQKFDLEHAYEYAKLGIQLKMPIKYKLFHDVSLYQWKIQDHFIRMAYYNKKYEEAVNTGIQLIKSKKLPKEEYNLAISNIKWCTKRLRTKYDYHPENKRIAIINKDNTFDYLLGCFAGLFRLSQIDVYINSTDFLNYYRNYFPNLLKANISRLDSNLHLYDYIFCLDPNDMNILSKVNQQRYSHKIILNNQNMDHKAITFNPISDQNVETQLLYPIHDKYGTFNYQKDNIITAITENEKVLIEILARYLTGYKLNLISKDCKLGKFKNTQVYNSIDIKRKLDLVTKSKFLLVLPDSNINHMISLAVNHNVPMIIDEKSNNDYRLKGNLVYKTSPLEVMDKFLELTDIEYFNLISELIHRKKEMFQENISKLNHLLS